MSWTQTSVILHHLQSALVLPEGENLAEALILTRPTDVLKRLSLVAKKLTYLANGRSLLNVRLSRRGQHCFVLTIITVTNIPSVVAAALRETYRAGRCPSRLTNKNKVIDNSRGYVT